MDIILTYSIASIFPFGFDSLKVLYMKILKNLMGYIINLFFINFMMIIIKFKYLKNIIYIKYNLGCQSFYLFFKIIQSFKNKNLFENIIGWEILLEKNSLEIDIELGYENNFNLDSLILSFASPSQEQDKNEVSDSGIDNDYGSEDEKEENYIPNKFIDKEKNSENNTQLEENNTRENNKTEAIDEDISNNNSVDIEEGFVGKLRRNFGFDNLTSLFLWNQNTNKNSSSSNSNNNESNTSDSNANSSSSSILNNNENNINSSTNTNNNNSKGRFYIDEDSDSDFGDFGGE